MMTYQDRQKLMDKITKNSKEYNQKLNELTNQIVKLQAEKRELEQKILDAYKANADKDGTLFELRKKIKEIEQEIENLEKEIDDLEPTRASIEKDTVQLLDLWIELAKQGENESLKKQQKIEELKKEIETLKNEADIYHSQAWKYAQQVREWSKHLSKDLAKKYEDFRI